MKKRLCLAIILLLIILSGRYYFENRYEFDYKRAQDAFVSGGDEKAFHLAMKAYKSDVTNIKYRKLFLETIKRLEFNYEAQSALLDFIEDDIQDTYQTEAILYQHSLQKIIGQKYYPNYIELAPYNNKIIRWSQPTIRVKLSKRNDLALYFMNEVESAFMEWQRAVDNKFVFAFEEKNPDITVEFAEKPKEEKNNYNVYVVANTEPEFDEDVLRSMKIVIYTKNNSGEYFSKEEVFGTALHEIAHALGVFGHSRDMQDILYFVPARAQEQGKYKTLSEKDINTMKLLYDMKPDISDGKSQYSIHSKLVLGDVTDINDVKLEEAKNYIKQAPSLPNGYIDLAQTAIFKKDYEVAKDNLKQAIKYATDNNTKFIIYYNYAVICYEMQDMNKALFYAQKAQEFRDKNSVTALLANIYYKKREYPKAIEQYEALVKNYPTSIMYSVNLAKLYINNWKILKASSVLKDLVVNNPESVNDKRVSKLRWLLLFNVK